MWLASSRRFVINAFIAVALAAVAVDTLPQSPDAVRAIIEPWLFRLGLNQGAWNLFAPAPDRVNTRLLAEITYRDGRHVAWNSPDWPHDTVWQRWTGHRRMEWVEHVTLHATAWPPWCRYLARTLRPDLKEADRGAEVRVIYHEAVIPPASERPWRPVGQPIEFKDSSVLTIEKFE